MAHYARRVAGTPEEAGSGSTADAFRAEMEALFGEIAAKSQPAPTPPSEPEQSGDREDDPGPPDEASSDTKH